MQPNPSHLLNDVKQ
jgi:hypothetical protein